MVRTYTKAHDLLTIENVNLNFEGNSILRNVNISVHDINRPGMQQGQVISLLGPSGSGKTQLFRSISGLLTPTSGEILMYHEDKMVPIKSGEVGFVFQHYPLMGHRTVIQNLMLAAKRHGKTKEDAMAMLVEFDLQSKINHYPAQLSGGQRQRISIIQQLLCSDHFVLMDEPFSGLDVVSKQKMMDMILKVSTTHDHNTLIITTHDIEAAVSISDTIWVLGFERDEKGVKIPGATIIKEIDLINLGLAWNPNVRNHPNFKVVVDQIYALFNSMA